MADRHPFDAHSQSIVAERPAIRVLVERPDTDAAIAAIVRACAEDLATLPAEQRAPLIAHWILPRIVHHPDWPAVLTAYLGRSVQWRTCLTRDQQQDVEKRILTCLPRDVLDAYLELCEWLRHRAEIREQAAFQAGLELGRRLSLLDADEGQRAHEPDPEEAAWWSEPDSSADACARVTR